MDEKSERVTLEEATPAAAPLLSNLLELYIHDLSEIFPIDLDPGGRFGYDKLPLYWSEPDARYAFLIRRGVVRVSEVNRAGLPFWSEIVRAYTGGAFTESTRPGQPNPWRVFRFTSPAAIAAGSA